MKALVIQPHSFVASLVVLGLSFTALGMSQDSAAREIQVLKPEHKRILDRMSIVYLDDGQGGTTKTIRFTGVNLQLEAFQPGLGNMIVGYNELGNIFGDIRSGRNALVVGMQNSYLGGAGTMVVGLANWSGAGVAVGGTQNRAIGLDSSATGGSANVVTGDTAWAGGGYLNTVDGLYGAVSGGEENTVSGYAASISGGTECSAVGRDSSVCGGFNRSAPGLYDWVAGGLFQEN